MASQKIQIAKQLVTDYGGPERFYGDYFSELKLAMSRAPNHVPDPRTGEGKTRFRLFRDWRETGGGRDHNKAYPDVVDLVSYLRDCSVGQAADWIIDTLGDGRPVRVTPQPVRRLTPAPYCSPEKAQTRIQRINQVTSESTLAANSSVVQQYIKNRGLDPALLTNALGFHPELYHPLDRCCYPAMVAQVRDVNGMLITHHRTYLNGQGGKAATDEVKLVMPSATDPRGAAIRLADPVEVKPGEYLVGLTEGIETGLAVMQMTNIPVWPTISNTLMEMVKLPAKIKYVLLFADRDLNGVGQDSAFNTARRLRREGRNAAVYVPSEVCRPGEKADWLDFMNDGHIAHCPIKPQPYSLSLA